MKYKTLKQELIDNDERDENNRRIIHLNVTDDGNFLSPLSVKGNPLISGETAEFLDYSPLFSLFSVYFLDYSPRLNRRICTC